MKPYIQVIQMHFNDRYSTDYLFRAHKIKLYNIENLLIENILIENILIEFIIRYLFSFF